MSYKLEPAIWALDTGQRIACFDRCPLIITCHTCTSIKNTVNQGSMSLSTYYLKDGCHVARLQRRRHPAYAPTRNTAGHNNIRKSIHGFSFISLYGYGAPLGGPLGHSSSAIKFCMQTLSTSYFVMKKHNHLRSSLRRNMHCYIFSKLYSKMLLSYEKA